jgi:hypothetical protein
MGERFTFENSGHTQATAKAAFDALADAPEWAKWGKPIVAKAKFAKTASPDPRGVGAVRAVGGAEPFLLKEETTVYEPDTEFGYRLVSPGPMRDYHARVSFKPNADGGTDIRWRGEFDERVPLTGPVIRFALDKLIGTFLTKLIRYLDARA